MDPQKIIGYTLLALGVLLISIPLFYTVSIFTGSALPPQIFKAPVIVQDPNAGFDLQKQMENAFIKILPLDLINGTLNLASWIMLLWILMVGGRYLADIGLKLLKHGE